MKRRNPLRSRIVPVLFGFCLIFIHGCKKNDCNIACFTPPQPFRFEIVDKASGENLFTNGTYQSQEIEVIDLDDSSDVELSFIDENDIDLIGIGSIGWETETVNILVKIDNDDIFSLFVDASRLEGKCCSYTEYNEIRIDNAEFKLDSASGIYKILVE